MSHLTAVSTDSNLGDDRHRKGLHGRLLAAVHEQVCPPAPREWILGTRAPSVSLRLAVGDAIKLADTLKIVVQYSRILSQACHAPDSLVGKFLAGNPDTCLGGLSWMAPLLQPIQHNSQKEVEHARLMDSCDTCDIPFNDRDFVRYLVSLVVPDALEFDVSVAQNILRYNPRCHPKTLRELFVNWRDSCLTHCLLVASQHMRTLNDWLPVEFHRDAHWFERLLQLLPETSTCEEVREILQECFDNFGSIESPVTTMLATLLDRIAILVRVKSNEPGVGLDDALKHWTLDANSRPHAIWANARCQLEASMPPSVLCPALYGRRRDTWGHMHLTLTWDGGAGLGTLKICQKSMGYLCKSGDAGLLTKYDPGLRVQDVIGRLGELLLSREMGHLMMFAFDGKEYLRHGHAEIKENERETCEDPWALLAYMNEPDKFMSPVDHIEAFQKELEIGLPMMTEEVFDTPLELTCWRLDPPSRGLLYTGTNSESLDAVLNAPHKLPKVLLDGRSSAKSVARIRLTDRTRVFMPVADVTSNLLYYAHRHYHGVTETIKRRSKPQTHTSMLEGLASFILKPAAKEATIKLHSSARWDKMYCDTRYSESQNAINGFRHRDWVVVYADSENPQKVRLDSHVITFNNGYRTQFPWRRVDGRIDWVNVASSVAPKLMVLHERTPDPGDGFRSLLSSVKARILQDLKLLPVRDESHRILRGNTSVYGDSSTGQVLVAYAPSDDPECRFEFMMFELCRA